MFYYKFNALKEQLAYKIRISSGPNAKGNYVISMTQEDIDEVTQLNLNEKGISNIEGIEGFRKLQKLYLYNNQITNINSLSNLTNLTVLALNSNNIKNITTLDLTN